MQMQKQLALWLLIAFTSGSAGAALAQEFSVVIKGHQFEPARLQVPAGVRFKLSIHNQDPTPEEFESYELNREKVIPGNSTATVYIGPLEVGEYPYFGEFNAETARGVLIATEG